MTDAFDAMFDQPMLGRVALSVGRLTLDVYRRYKTTTQQQQNFDQPIDIG